EGFTMGIGVIIAAQQVPLALDTPKAPGENAALVAWRTLGLVDWAGAWVPLLLVGLVIAIMVGLPRMNRTLPSSLIAVVVVTGRVVHRLGATAASLPARALRSLAAESTSARVAAALAVAALAALESVLSARVADGMTDNGPRTDHDRELVGQGVANVAAGIF